LNNANYFPHDCNARTDEKILQIRAEFGNAAYAWYFMLLECMAETPEGKLSFDSGAIGGLSLGLSIPKDKLKKFIDYAIKIQLFESDEKYFWSERMLEHIEYRKQYRQQKVKAGKKGASVRWGKNNSRYSGANGSANGGVMAKNGKEKKRKEKKSKKKRKRKYSSIKSLKEKDFKDIAKKYGVNERFVIDKYDDLVNYCKAKGRRYKNYKRALMNFVKKDKPEGSQPIKNNIPDIPKISKKQREKNIEMIKKIKEGKAIKEIK